ncbi:MAG: N-acetylneuraminate synthase family protein [Planctomycetota bacterium]
MNIGNRHIGTESPYLIAEIGVNHDGDAGRAVELTHAAADAGADAVKLQYFEADRLMSRASRLATYQAQAGESDPHEMLRRLELSVDDMARVVEVAHQRGIHAIVTIFSVELVAPAMRLAWDALKVASPDIVNKPLLRALESTQLPLILSTGAATTDEVLRALGWLRGANGRLAVLQCVSSYPTPVESAELGGIEALAALFAGPVGYSDHTSSHETSTVAVELGAAILEKHLTHNKAASGPDHAASLEPSELATYARLARESWVRGRAKDWHRQELTRRRNRELFPPVKRVLGTELDVRKLSRQSLVAARDLPAGHRITRDDLTIKRPGTGLEPCRLESTIGLRTMRPVAIDTPLVEDDLTSGSNRSDVSKAA